MAEAEREELHGMDQALLSGSLKNTDRLLGHLQESQQVELAELIRSFPSLFGDTHKHTSLTERLYRVSAEKRKHLDAEVKYMLENGTAEP